MTTAAFITYMLKILNADLGRDNIREAANRAQNEIFSFPNRITQIQPDPYVHTGSDDYTVASSGNDSGDPDLVVDETITTTNPTAGYLIITNGTITDKLKFVSYSASTFTLASGVTLPRTYGSGYTATIDSYQCVPSGAIFSSINNQTTQWDIRKVTRVYSFNSAADAYFAYGGDDVVTFRPEVPDNYSSHEVEIPADNIDSIEPDSNDAELVFWRENSPGVTTSTFIARAFRWPDQLTTESVALTLPDHYQKTLLKYAILKEEEYKQYGRNNHPEALFEKYLKKFQADSAVGATTIPSATVPRF